LTDSKSVVIIKATSTESDGVPLPLKSMPSSRVREVALTNKKKKKVAPRTGKTSKSKKEKAQHVYHSPPLGFVPVGGTV
jgi:hypothetical protein